MGAFWVTLTMTWFFFFPDFLLKVFPFCSSDKKDHDSVVPVSGWVLGPNWPFLFWGLRCSVMTWAARVWDVIHGPCYACDDFRGAGTQWEHLNPLQQHSLEAADFLRLLFVLTKKCREKNTLSPVILKFQNSLGTNMLLLYQTVSVAFSWLCASPLLHISAALYGY